MIAILDLPLVAAVAVDRARRATTRPTIDIATGRCDEPLRLSLGQGRQQLVA
jgi:hypothetical protein